MRAETYLKSIICSVLMLFGMGYARAATWTTLDMPGGYNTLIYGIDGSNLVGEYANKPASTPRHSFLYNGTTWTTLDMPGANVQETSIKGIDGSNLVGTVMVS